MAEGHHGRRDARQQGSQYPLRRASSWRASSPPPSRGARSCLNTLSGGHPLGGGSTRTDAEGLQESQYPLRRASSWRTLAIIPAIQDGRVSQYPLRRASSWRTVLVWALYRRSEVSIPSQAGILLAGEKLAMVNGLDAVSIPSQAGILLAVVTWFGKCSFRWSQYPLRRASSWCRRPRRLGAIRVNSS